MLPNPLHPAVVHFPIVLAVLFPIVAITALVLIWRGRPHRPLWVVVVMLAGALTASSWAAVETGEEQEEVVEDVVSRRPMHEHEEAAETFLWLAVAALAIVGGGLINGRVGQVARIVGSGAALAVLVAAVQVGHSGGELVYVHGAAQAYVDGGTVDRDNLRRAPTDGDRYDSDDDDDEHARGADRGSDN